MKMRRNAFEEFERLTVERLRFLETEFGFRVTDTQREPYGSFISFQNATTGLRISLEPREGGLFVLLTKLVNGKIPPYPIFVGLNTPLTSFYLDDLVTLRAPRLQLDFKKQKLSSSDQIKAALGEIGEVLRKYASDVLGGDFSVFNALAAIVKRRAQELSKKSVRS